MLGGLFAGRLVDEPSFRQRVFYGGADPQARPLVWKLLLGVFPPGAGAEERRRAEAEQLRQYGRLRAQWRSIGKEQAARWGYLWGVWKYLLVVIPSGVRRGRGGWGRRQNGGGCREGESGVALPVGLIQRYRNVTPPPLRFKPTSGCLLRTLHHMSALPCSAGLHCRFSRRHECKAYTDKAQQLAI